MRALCVMLAGLSLACAHVPTPGELFAQGRHGDAVALLLARQGQTHEEEQERVAELDRFAELHRHSTPGRVLARVLPAEEIARLTGAAPSDAYGTSIVLVEVRIAPGSENNYVLMGLPSLEEHSHEEQEEVGMWAEEIVQPGESIESYSMLGEVLTKLWPYPPLPPLHCTPGDGTYIPPSDGQFLAGFFLTITAITPITSLLTGKDQVSPFFRGRYIPGKHPARCDPPTKDEMNAWRASKPVHAAESMRNLLAGREPGDRSGLTRMLTLFKWVRRSSSGPCPAAFLDIGLYDLMRTSTGQVTRAGGWVRVPLKPGVTIADQIAATFGNQGVDVAPLGSRW